MHECPYCYVVCDCDGEDLWQDAPLDCQCSCVGKEDEEDFVLGEDDVDLG